jgi:hypothetical protein
MDIRKWFQPTNDYAASAVRIATEVALSFEKKPESGPRKKGPYSRYRKKF